MSFTGIFKAKNGIVAVVDSKASRVENGQSYEDVHRNPEKLFVFQNGIATTFGANQILVQNPFEFSSKVIAIEDLVYEYLHLITMVFYHICVFEFHIAFVRMMASKCLQYQYYALISRDTDVFISLLILWLIKLIVFSCARKTVSFLVLLW